MRIFSKCDAGEEKKRQDLSPLKPTSHDRRWHPQSAMRMKYSEYNLSGEGSCVRRSVQQKFKEERSTPLSPVRPGRIGNKKGLDLAGV
jgi:hypothetical protein